MLHYCRAVYHAHITFLVEIRAVHELKQAYKGVNPCDALNCTGLCLLRPKEDGSSLKAVCACPEYFQLASDNRTCLSKCSKMYVFMIYLLFIYTHLLSLCGII